MKYIIIVPDGMHDYPIESLGDRTPLEAAHTNNMDFLAKQGMTGLVKTIPDKMKPGSEIGNLSLLGYDPEKVFTGRAPLEAANMGIDLGPDEVAFRCNLVTIYNDVMKDYSSGHISSPEAALLIDALNDEMGEPNVRFFAGKSYRHLAVIKTLKVNDYLDIKVTPPHDFMEQDIKKYLPKGPEAQRLQKLIEKSKQILENHPTNNVRIDLKENPGNMIWLWGQGVKPQLPKFKEKYGVSGAIISAVDLVNGIGRLAGLEVVTVPGITGYYDTNYLGKAEYAMDALKRHDFVFIHIEAPDEAGHNGDAKAKIDCIEKIDREIVGTVLNHFDPNAPVRIMVLSDHPTPVALRTHARDPVACVIYGKGIAQDGSEAFNEAISEEKGLRFKNGVELLDFFMNKYI